MSENQTNICSFCKKPINNSDNYCKNCGEPLTELANTLELSKHKNAQLEVLINLSGEIKDLASLSKLKEYMNFLKTK